MCLVPNLVAHPRDDGPPPLRRVCPTNTALDAAAGRTTVAPPSISNTTPHFAWGGAGPGKQNERISPESLLVDGPPIRWPWAALARKDREGDQAGERDRIRVRAPFDGKRTKKTNGGGGGDDKGEIPDPPHGARGAAEQTRSSGAEQRSSGADAGAARSFIAHERSSRADFAVAAYLCTRALRDNPCSSESFLSNNRRGAAARLRLHKRRYTP